jgi:pimeloyl-ACP methyl ester carboxylesterase
MSTLFCALLSFSVVTCLARHNPTVAAGREYFYVGGEYTDVVVGHPEQYKLYPELTWKTGNTTAQVKLGQIYVEKLVPPNITREHPLVFIAGYGQTGTNFLNTPDGRQGWASYFLDQGFIVYLSDQPARGRSLWHPTMGAVSVTDTITVQQMFRQVVAIKDTFNDIH